MKTYREQHNQRSALQIAAAALALACSASCALAAEPTAAPKGRADQGAVLANQTCVACHGPGGNPTMPDYPRLAGQLPEYLAKQLRAFQAPAGQRSHRTSPIMQPLAASLNEQQILDLAALRAERRLDLLSDAVTRPALPRGASAVLRACFSVDLAAWRFAPEETACFFDATACFFFSAACTAGVAKETLKATKASA